MLRLLLAIAQDVKGAPPAVLIPAFDMLNTRYRENLSVKEYADKCHMSESHFRKKFTEYTGKSPIQYRNELRFAEARRLYLDGATMSEIANEVGFFDAGYFSKMYKKSNGHLLSSESSKDMIWPYQDRFKFNLKVIEILSIITLKSFWKYCQKITSRHILSVRWFSYFYAFYMS